MRRRTVALLAVVGSAMAAPVAISDPAPVMPVVAPPVAPAPTVVSVKVMHPKLLRIIRSRFTPWGEPTPGQAHFIAEYEAAREGVSLAGLEARIKCESTWQWNNEYAGHYGLGQFLPSTWSRGWATVGSRAVTIRRVTERPVVAKRVELLSDGSTRVVARWRVRQKVIHIERGMLPRDPPLMHGWAQVRVMAEALAGRSAVSSSEWSCAA